MTKELIRIHLSECKENESLHPAVRKVASLLAASFDARLDITVHHAAAGILCAEFAPGLVETLIPAAVYEKAMKLIRTLVDKFSAQTVVAADLTYETKRKSQLARILEESGITSSKKDEVTHFKKYRVYQEGQSDLMFWSSHEKEYPMLAKVARMYQIPASSIKSEQTFSRADRLLGMLRNRMKPHKLEKIMLFTANEKLISSGVLVLDNSLRADADAVASAQDREKIEDTDSEGDEQDSDV